MTKGEIAGVLEEIGTMLELKGENPFKIRAYANAARSIDAWGGSLSDLQDEEALAKVPGIGKAIAAKIKELATSGSLKYVEDLRAEFPPAILELFSIPGLGAKKIKALYDKLHISTIAELLKACESGRVAQLPGFGEMTQEKLCKAIADRVKHSGSFQFGHVASEAESLRNDFASHPEVLQVCIAGSYRRRKEIVRDLDLMMATKNRGEFQAAEKHSLPRLIEAENLRGTFHCHTTASDGHNTLEEMAQAAQALGLEYLGIAEHSRSSIQARGLDEAKLRAQVAAIRKLNKTFDGFRLFAGVECDILRDGSLDFEDKILSELDYVVASVHSVFNLSEKDMTRRVIRGMENPFVTILAHPTGRLLLKREPYQIDIPAILDAAAETGTWVELNAAPKRLDLDWRWWPRAKEKGVKCVIDPDAHRVERLQDLWFGVGVARKGWLTKEDVVNCLPLGKIERALRLKREKKS